jgi:hypothetical protein
MTKSEFNLEIIKWAEGILSQPAYIMPNGKNSHDVANLELCEVIDRLPFENKVDVYGNFVA